MLISSEILNKRFVLSVRNSPITDDEKQQDQVKLDSKGRVFLLGDLSIDELEYF